MFLKLLASRQLEVAAMPAVEDSDGFILLQD